VGISECLRSELVHEGVAVTVVCPPEVETPMVETEKKTMLAEARAVKLMAGTLDPDAVAETIITGVARRRFLIIPGARARMTYVAHALSFGWTTRTVSDFVIRRARC